MKMKGGNYIIRTDEPDIFHSVKIIVPVKNPNKEFFVIVTLRRKEGENILIQTKKPKIYANSKYQSFLEDLNQRGAQQI